MTVRQLFGWLVGLIVLFSGCAPLPSSVSPTAAPPTEPGVGRATVPAARPDTPTPTVVADVGDPNPVMARCVAQATEHTVIAAEQGYCFTFPEGFAQQAAAPGLPVVVGPPLDRSADPVRATLAIEVSEAPAGATLEQIVGDFVAEHASLPVPPIEQQPATLAGEPAVRLEVVPGRTGSRDLFVLHGGQLYRLLFMPSVRDFPQAEADVEKLYAAVLESFVFLPTFHDEVAIPPPETPSPAARICRNVTRPALVYGPGPGRENELAIVSLDGQTACAVPLRGLPVPPLLSVAGRLWYEVIDPETDSRAIWQLGPGESDHPLPFTEFQPSYLPLPFTVSEDGNRIAYTLVEQLDPDDFERRRSTLYVAQVDGSSVEPLLTEMLDGGRVLQPVRFKAETGELLYSVASTAYGGMWNGMHGRYANLYRVAIPAAEPRLIFQCGAGTPFCIGDVSPDGRYLAYVDVQAGKVHVLDTEGALLSELAGPAADYVGFPTFGPSGELAFLSAELPSGNQPPLPAPGYVSVAAPPYTGAAETWIVTPGVTRIWSWAGPDHLILLLEGPFVPPVDLLSRDGTVQPLQEVPQAVLH